jgi:hypothetical protein
VFNYFSEVIDGGALLERDQNPENKKYQLCWRSSTGFDEVHVRPVYSSEILWKES